MDTTNNLAVNFGECPELTDEEIAFLKSWEEQHEAEEFKRKCRQWFTPRRIGVPSRTQAEIWKPPRF